MAGGFSVLPASTGTDEKATSGTKILGPAWARFPILTVGLLGVQILWSVEMSYASPYLISLGISKSSMAMVFVAGPLSGLLVQPLVGILADSSTSRWGRRRPYMLAGCSIAAFSMLLLGYTPEFAAVFTGRDTPFNDTLTIWLAVLAIYLADFSINAVMSVDRALMVDSLPPSLQAPATAWAARMLGFGGLFGFFVGNLDLPAVLPSFGSTELQVLSVIVAGILVFGHLTTILLVKEEPFERPDGQRPPSLIAELRRLFTSLFSLPCTIQQICLIQFFASMGWFPILFYTTMYISDLHARSVSASASIGTQTEIAAQGARLGSRGLFFSAILSLLTNIFIPYVTRTANTPSGQRFKVPLTTVWAYSHLVFGACMLGTFFVTSVNGAIFTISITGIPWAVAQWAPYSLLGEAILTSTKPTTTTTVEANPLLERPVKDVEHGAAAKLDIGNQAGLIIGIHNIYSVIPQFIVTILCAVVFAIFEGPDSSASVAAAAQSRPNSVVYIFRLGALWSFIAFKICRRLGRELRR
ncbi:hypothetical protein MKEN_01477000 [Mycena kentingensis (nom. inval.)]|nr:hypothetical protein MKEN_01477000 [Mycena kentingensis (nom. inval.)]